MADTTTTATTQQPPNSTKHQAIDNSHTPPSAVNAIASRKWSPPIRNSAPTQPQLSTELLCTALTTLKPPGSPNPPNNTPTSASASTSSPPPSAFVPKTTCKCTKIGLMQLFHEMKQEFATVPDYLVHQYVTDNCHNRPALLDALKLESQRFPGSVQAYPQALRNQCTPNPSNHICNNTIQVNAPSTTNHPLSNATPSKSIVRPPTMANPHNPQPSTKPPPHAQPSAPSVPGRRSGVRHNNVLHSPMQPPTSTSNANNHNYINNNNNNRTINNEIDPSTDAQIAYTPNDDVNLSSRLTSDNTNETTQSDTSRTNPSGDPNPTIENHTKPKVPQRPSTLNLPSSSLAPTPPFHLVAAAADPIAQQHPPTSIHSQSTPSGGQPTRVAPPPPRASQHKPIDSPLNVSVNVTVSPMAGSHTSPRNVRHTSAITVHPEIWPFPPAAQAPADGTPMRSFTSVQFKLRPPVAHTTETSFTSPQPSPIDISAGPSLLTYSSASFDARIGLQSHLQITVDGGGNGSISATRSRPRNFYTTPSDAETNTTSSADRLRVGPPTVQPARSGGSHSGQLDEAEVVHRQIVCKRRLALELENDRKRLARMQHEINTLSAPIPVGGSNQLVADIQRLQHSCKQMVQMVEEAGPYVLGETDEGVIQQILSSQTLPRAQRPPRPPAPQSSSASSPATPNIFAISPSNASPNFHQLPNYLHPTTPPMPPQQQLHLHRQPEPQQQQLQPWSCNMCTFQNHPLMNKCEQCEMPLLTTSVTTSGEDIYIHVSPGRNSVIHSWVLS